MSEATLRVRAAYPREIPTLIEFNRAMARETEAKELDPERSKRGVEAVFAEPARGLYYAALRGEELVGALLLTSEWSDWRNGVFWWIQSVYVVPSARRSGVFRALYAYVLERARADPDVCGLRLYVDRDNQRAQAVYTELGMTPAHYRLFELDFVHGAEKK
ncbi:MAG: GNAT family N-acetyltransferase [Planctomycetota bacterium]